VLPRRATIVLSAATGIALELRIYALSGRRDAWDSRLFWTVGMPIALLAAVVIGFTAQGPPALT
jgi:hypothetical protein